MGDLHFSNLAWTDYLYWQTQDRKTLKRVNALIRDIQRSPFDGIGKPEPLKGDMTGLWSRRIDDIRPCLKIVRTLKWRGFFRYAALIFLEIHKVFLRKIALPDEKIPRP